MANKEIPLNESSILLKYPINMFSSNTNTENLLMPVGVQDISVHFPCSTEISEACKSLDSSELRLPSLCQLEQPLHVGAISKPKGSDQIKMSEIDIAVESVMSLGESLGHINFSSSSNVQTTATSCVSQNFPCYPSLSPQVDISPSVCTNFSRPTLESTPAMLESVTTYLPDPLLHTSDSQSELSAPTALSGYNFTENNILPEDSVRQNTSYGSFDPVKPYWLFQDTVESKEIWYGFSERDSERLENSYQQGLEYVVSTDGGRYDVYLQTRMKKSIYFDSKELHVRRCTWFYQQGSSMRFKPYDENTAACLEDCYRSWITSGAQESRFIIPGFIGSFLFEKPQVMLHYGIDANAWSPPNEPKGSPKIVRRGLPDCFQVMPSESSKIDHLLFIVQGIGSFCDLRFRTVSECVDGFRDIANKLIGSHFRKHEEQGFIGRVEILPVAWHAKLRTSDIGLDRTMKMITLPSIPKLRHFTNDTLIDILLYSSPSYCQSIINTVAEELNNIYEVFLSRNPNFSGKVFVAGHSLGSLILFDILSNQNFEDKAETKLSLNNENSQGNLSHVFEKFSNINDFLKYLELDEYLAAFNNEKIDLSALPHLSDEDVKNLGLPIGPRIKLMNLISPKEKMSLLEPYLNESCLSAKRSEQEAIVKVNGEKKAAECKNRMIFPLQKSNTGMSLIVYPRLLFHPAAFFAMGSPISMFLAIRGFDSISETFSFPTCAAFFHIFHPYDPVAFRIEPMIDHNFKEKPALIPHHKGRKRMHLEIKENVAKFASELRQKVMDTLHKTWNSFNEITRLHPFPSAVMEHEVNSMVSHELPEITTYDDQSVVEVVIGNLNGGRRIDYVLQEKPLEALNDYVWALTSHATYWDSEDTVLMILREIYAIQGINVSPFSETDNFVSESSSLNRTGAKDYLPFSTEFLEKTLYPHIPTRSLSENTSSNETTPSPSFINTSESAPFTPVTFGSSVSIPGSKHIGPPPLSGFVKRSAFSK